MKSPKTVDRDEVAQGDRSSRREFVKRSLLACASGVVIGDTLGATAPSPSSPAQPHAAPPGSEAAPAPVFPFGSGTPIVLSDLDRCEPREALARSWKRGCWKLVDFEAGDLKGTMLTCGQNSDVNDIEYPLNRTGWFAIYFGLASKYHESRLEVRLKSGATFSLLTHNRMADAGLNRRDIEFAAHGFTTREFDEVFWRCVELRDPGESIVLRQLKVKLENDGARHLFMPCWLGYIRLVPLDGEEVRRLKADRADSSNRRLFATHDAFGSASWLGLRSEEDIRREFEPYRDTDFSRIYWEAGMGDVTYFPSSVGRLLTFEWMESAYRLQDRLVGATYRGFRERGIDPFRVAIEGAREVGLEFHAAYRVAGFHFPNPEDEWNAGGLYDRHPEWRGVSRSGEPTPRLSYAFPGVRRFVIDLLREIVAYPVDGVCLLFNRRLPVLDHEEPLIEEFRKQFGRDPRTLDENDPRWIACRSGILTAFMGEVRDMLAEEARRQRRNRPFELTAVVASSREENLEGGLDLDAWVRRGLVDTIVPYSSTAGLSSDAPSWVRPADAQYFIRLTRGTACKLALNLMPRQILPEDYRSRAHALYEAGVEYLYFWDCYQRCNFDRSWSTLCRLGHREELADWARQGSPPVARPQRKLTKIADWDLRFGTPG